MSLNSIEVGEGTILVQGILYFRRDIKEKWKKLMARLVFISNLHALRLCDLKDNSERTIDTITITKDLVTVGPIPEKDKILFHLANGRKQVHLSCKLSNVVTDWINVIECVAEIKRDPSKYVGEEFLKQKITAKLTSSETLTGDAAKMAQIANQLAKNARGFTEVDLLRKETVDCLEDKIVEKRDRVVLELLQTEQSYLRSLSVLTNAFKLPMKKYMKELSITEEELITLFGNLDDIVRVSTTLFEELLKCYKDWSKDKLISAPLLQTIPFLKMYNQYSVNYNNSVNCFAKLKKKEEFKTFVETIAADPVCAGLNLGSYLIMPIQRIPRYVLLLTELIHHTPTSHPDHEGLTKVLNALKDIADNVNYAPQQQEQLDTTLTVIQKFEKYKELKLIQPGRKFIRQTEGKHGAKKRHYFLMSDLLICASEKLNGKYTISNKFDGSKITIEDDPTQPNTIIIHKDKEGAYAIHIAEDKKLWIDTLKVIQTVGFKSGDSEGLIDNVDDEKQTIPAHRASVNNKPLQVNKSVLIDSSDSSFRDFLKSELSLEKYISKLVVEDDIESVKEELLRVQTKFKTIDNEETGNSNLEYLTSLCQLAKMELHVRNRIFGQFKFKDTFVGEDLIQWLRVKKSYSEKDAFKLADDILKNSLIVHCPKDNLPFTKICCYEFRVSDTSSPKTNTKSNSSPTVPKLKLGQQSNDNITSPKNRAHQQSSGTIATPKYRNHQQPNGSISTPPKIKLTKLDQKSSDSIIITDTKSKRSKSQSLRKSMPAKRRETKTVTKKDKSPSPTVLTHSTPNNNITPNKTSEQSSETTSPSYQSYLIKSHDQLPAIPATPPPPLPTNLSKTYSDSSIQNEDPSKNLKKIIQTICEPSSGLVKKRKHHLKTHKSCLVASEFIDWLIETKQATDRQKAIELAENMMKNNLIVPLTTQEIHSFKDGNTLYKIVQ